MKVLFIAPMPFFHERGACIRAMNMVRAMMEFGHEVDVLTYPIGRDMEGISTIRAGTLLKPPVEARMNISRMMADFMLYRKAMKICKEYDMAIGKTPIGILIARLVKGKAKIPIAIDMVESIPFTIESYIKRKLFGRMSFLFRLFSPFVIRIAEKMENGNLKEADVIIANWELTAEFIRSKGRKCILLHDFIEVKTMKKHHNGTILMHTGASTPQQGINIYLEAMKLLKHKARLIIVGDKGNHNDSGNVTFTGRKPIEEMQSCLGTADILLTAYNTGGRNAPLKLVSYLFQRKPIVASDVPQHRQILNDDNAFLAKPEPEDFARMIDFVLDNPKEARRRANNAYRLAVKSFSKESYMKGISGIFKRNKL